MQDNNIINRLFSSFTELEQAISSARKTLASRDSVPVEIVTRLSSYDGILSKQRNLATDLCEHITAGNWDEVSRHVSLINGLSALIRDDARAILNALSAQPVEAKDEVNFC